MTAAIGAALLALVITLTGYWMLNRPRTIGAHSAHHTRPYTHAAPPRPFVPEQARRALREHRTCTDCPRRAAAERALRRAKFSR